MISILGTGPSGLIASYWLLKRGMKIRLYDAMPQAATKLRLAGIKGGLMLSRLEDEELFVSRFDRPEFRGLIKDFPPSAMPALLKELGLGFTATKSGKLFPEGMDSKILIDRLTGKIKSLGGEFFFNSRLIGFSPSGNLILETGSGREEILSDAVLLALGGASWPKTGSNGLWVDSLKKLGAKVNDFKPSNAGFEAGIPSEFLKKYEGRFLKNIEISFHGITKKTEAVLTGYGIESPALYYLTPMLRDAIEAKGNARIEIRLRPNLTKAAMIKRLSRPRGRNSISNFLRKALGISPQELFLIRNSGSLPEAPELLYERIQKVPLVLTAIRPLEEAISSKGGLDFSELDEFMMIRRLPGVFSAGEMIDWEAPTGGYLVHGCLASAIRAALGIEKFIKTRSGAK